MFDGIKAYFRGSRVTVDVRTASEIAEDDSHEHARLWVHFLKGAIANLEEELAHEGTTGERFKEIQEQLADKRRQVYLTEAKHKPDHRDAQYVADHIARALKK